MSKPLTRRETLKVMGLGIILPGSMNQQPMLKRIIPSTDETIPAVGLGTWRQFDVGTSAAERAPLAEVMKNMISKGGITIDSSPMYAPAEEVVGDLAHETNLAEKYFYATKVWTKGKEEGIRQMEASMKKMRRTTMDLMQVHNLVDWQTHLATLRDWKQQKKIRYIGVTHYTDSSHDDLERIVKTEKLDFVQFNYSIRSRHAENRLLNAAKDSGTAVIINQPFETGASHLCLT